MSVANRRDSSDSSDNNRFRRERGRHPERDRGRPPAEREDIPDVGPLIEEDLLDRGGAHR